jgi:histidine triad (HIT) family protein
MSELTLFERIILREIPAKIVYEDESVIAIEDTNPVAPVHILVIPKYPYKDMNQIGQELIDSQSDSSVISKLFKVIYYLVVQYDLKDSGFRVVANTGKDAGQQVPHFHLHLLGGKILGGIG